MKKVIIIGSGGHSKVVIDILLRDKKLEIVGILDDNYEKLEYKQILGIDILGSTKLIQDFGNDYSYIIAIGDNKIRRDIFKKYSSLKYITAIHPSAIIGENVELGEGTVIMPRAVINSYSKIGAHCILNSGSIVEHDSKIENFVHISPSVTVCGGVTIQKRAWIGAGSIVIQGITIGENSIVGAGSLVISNIDKFSKVVGRPAVAIKI